LLTRSAQVELVELQQRQVELVELQPSREPHLQQVATVVRVDRQVHKLVLHIKAQTMVAILQDKAVTAVLVDQVKSMSNIGWHNVGSH
jgi:hypothetical protein